MELWLGRSLSQELHKPGIGTNYCCALFACTCTCECISNMYMYTSLLVELHNGTANFQN